MYIEFWKGGLYGLRRGLEVNRSFARLLLSPFDFIQTRELHQLIRACHHIRSMGLLPVKLQQNVIVVDQVESLCGKVLWLTNIADNQTISVRIIVYVNRIMKADNRATERLPRGISSITGSILTKFVDAHIVHFELKAVNQVVLDIASNLIDRRALQPTDNFTFFLVGILTLGGELSLADLTCTTVAVYEF